MPEDTLNKDLEDEARAIVRLIESRRIPTTREMDAHDAILTALSSHYPDVTSEVSIAPSSRIDALVTKEGMTIGIEIKIKGQRRSIYRQLERYAALDRIDALVLATGTPWPTGMTGILGKPFFIASLSKGWL